MVLILLVRVRGESSVLSVDTRGTSKLGESLVVLDILIGQGRI